MLRAAGLLSRCQGSTGWAVSELPRGARAYVVGLPLAAFATAGWLLRDTSSNRHDVVVAALLLVFGSLSVEATRRVGQPSGTLVKDLLSVWWLPMAVLLPPVYVLLAPIPLLALTHWRLRTSLIYRRVFSAASIGLAYAAGSVVFHAAVSGRRWPPAGPGLLRWALAVGAAGLFAAAANAVLVAVAVKAVDPQTRWRELLWDTESVRLEAVETCLGVTVAVLVALQPPLAAFALPPVLLLQRGMLHAQLHAAARTDAKTGLLNAPTWEREAEGKLLALHRWGQPASILLIDVDHFKGVNDTHGHLAGDRVLHAVADTMAGGVRAGDLLGRFGGEEFVALLPAADAEETARVAERIRAQVAALVVPLDDGQAVSVTVSIGVAATDTRALTVPDLLAAADHFMYRAKESGRNQVASQT